MAGWNWDQVRPMMGRGTGAGTGRGFAALQEVRAYWEGLRSDDALPGRAGIDPRGMEQALENVFLLERVAPGVARFRLAGMHLTLLMGMEVRGMPFSTFFEPAARIASEALVEAVFADPAIVELAVEAERGIGKPALEGRILLLPVLGDDGTCDRALGCFVTLGEIGRSPRRFAIARQVTHPVVPRATMTAVPQKPIPELGFAEPMPLFAPDKRPTRAHLRLVRSDD
jgi:hypothetical protein